MNRVQYKRNAEQKYLDLEQALKLNGASDESSFNMTSFFDYVRNSGLLNNNSKDVNKAWNKLDTAIAKSKDFGPDIFYTLFNSKATHKGMDKIMDAANKVLPDYLRHKDLSETELRRIIDDSNGVGIGSGNPGAGVPAIEAPGYYDLAFNRPELLDRPVDPVKLWTGAELAELLDINYDVDHYFDLIKQGTKANVAKAQFAADQAYNALIRDDAMKAASYLDAIKNTKSMAITKGTTAGARAAAEILANTMGSKQYSAAQAQGYADRNQLLSKPVKYDARANVQANQYFDSIMAGMGGLSNTLYTNDTDRYVGDWDTNERIYAADAELRGQLAQANANMFRDYAGAKGNAYAANASIQAAAGAGRQRANDYWTLYEMNRDRALANGASADFAKVAGIQGLENYVRGAYTGAQSSKDTRDKLKLPNYFGVN